MEMKKLLNVLPQIGTLEWIGIRPIKRKDLVEVEEVEIKEKTGLEGDHFSSRSDKRAVTLIQKEHLQTVASILNKEISPLDTRRNLVVSGINLLALNKRKFQIGEEVILEGTGHCHPCSRMEKNLGEGGYNAMRGHGGLTTRVIKGGFIKKGDKVKPLD